MSAKKIKKVKTMPSSVCRVNKNANYTVMSNYHLRSTNLSLKAIGLLSKVLSLPENWVYSISGLTAICKEKETAIKAALDELKHWGYLTVTKLMPNETKSGRIEYVFVFFVLFFFSMSNQKRIRLMQTGTMMIHTMRTKKHPLPK